MAQPLLDVLPGYCGGEQIFTASWQCAPGDIDGCIEPRLAQGIVVVPRPRRATASRHGFDRFEQAARQELLVVKLLLTMAGNPCKSGTVYQVPARWQTLIRKLQGVVAQRPDFVAIVDGVISPAARGGPMVYDSAPKYQRAQVRSRRRRNELNNKVMILGAGGQLGRELVRSAGADVACEALPRSELDIGDREAVARCLASASPSVVINAAAYTAVDAAESDVEAASRGNATGPQNLALACAAQGIRLLHVSTDFVFNGESAHPYTPSADTAPLGEYGRSKLAGEQAVAEALPGALIMRTGWVYSGYGNNFVKTMLRLMGERDELAVVADQVGTPTWARGLAAALWAAVERPGIEGIYHWSDAGVCSWYDFAVAISEEAHALDLLSRPTRIRPIPASDYPTPARRPAYSVLDKQDSWRDLELEPVHWRQQLRLMLQELKELKDD